MSVDQAQTSRLCEVQVQALSSPTSAPNSPPVRPVNMSAATVSWNTDFHLGAPRVESWRLLISTGQERQLTVTGKVLSLTVDIDSLEESNTF